MKSIDEIKSEHFEIQKAIKFIADKFLENNGTQKQLDTDKPVFLHSIRVGLSLLKFNYNKDLIIAGILHDVIEDANVDIDEIENKFGKKIAKIVQAVSVDRKIEDGKKRHGDLHQREIECGRDAIIVAIADHLDNIPYLKYAKNDEEYEKVKSRWFIFFDEVAKIASNEIIYQEYKKQMYIIKDEVYND